MAFSTCFAPECAATRATPRAVPRISPTGRSSIAAAVSAPGPVRIV
ncbi:hypothetical protein ACFVJH_02185 [Streptomyces decoyicus]